MVNSRILGRTFECVFFFGFAPLALWQLGFAHQLLIMLWGASAFSLVFLKTHYHYSFKTDWNWSAVNAATFKPIFYRFLLACVGLFVFTLVLEPARLFSFVREKPLWWMVVMVLYPILSVIPQELIYRTLFFKRYAIICGERIVLASAIAFGLAHSLLGNVIAVSFCVIGGFLFAGTYRKHKSLALACIEHALYGCAIFTIGLGYYFYHGRA